MNEILQNHPPGPKSAFRHVQEHWSDKEEFPMRLSNRCLSLLLASVLSLAACSTAEGLYDGAVDPDGRDAACADRHSAADTSHGSDAHGQTPSAAVNAATPHEDAPDATTVQSVDAGEWDADGGGGGRDASPPGARDSTPPPRESIVTLHVVPLREAATADSWQGQSERIADQVRPYLASLRSCRGPTCERRIADQVSGDNALMCQASTYFRNLAINIQSFCNTPALRARCLFHCTRGRYAAALSVSQDVVRRCRSSPSGLTLDDAIRSSCARQN